MTPFFIFLVWEKILKKFKKKSKRILKNLEKWEKIFGEEIEGKRNFEDPDNCWSSCSYDLVNSKFLISFKILQVCSYICSNLLSMLFKLLYVFLNRYLASIIYDKLKCDKFNKNFGSKIKIRKNAGLNWNFSDDGS